MSRLRGWLRAWLRGAHGSRLHISSLMSRGQADWADNDGASSAEHRIELGQIVQFTDISPVFVLGLTRSGTSAMTGALLDGAGLFGWREGHLFPLLGDLLLRVKRHWDELVHYSYAPGFPREEYALGQLDIHQVLNAVVATFDRVYRGRATAWVDKTATVEAVLAAPLLKHIYPRAKFIYMHRHPIKLALSRDKKFPDCSLQYSFRLWAECMEAWTRVRTCLPPDCYEEVAQLELSRQPEAVVERIAALLNLSAPQQEGMRAALLGPRLEYTGSSPDGVELSLEDTGWNRSDRKACVTLCGAQARLWGYRLSRSG
jgi:Sulfotransferase family